MRSVSLCFGRKCLYLDEITREKRVSQHSHRHINRERTLLSNIVLMFYNLNNLYKKSKKQVHQICIYENRDILSILKQGQHFEHSVNVVFILRTSYIETKISKHYWSVIQRSQILLRTVKQTVDFILVFRCITYHITINWRPRARAAY